MVSAEGLDSSASDQAPAKQVEGARVAIPAPPELGEATISGSFPEGVTVVSRTSASLHIVPGHVGGEDGEIPRKFLLPFAEFRLGGGAMAEMEAQTDERSPPTLLAATVSLENLAFMVLDLTGDLRGLCSEASSMAGGKLRMDPVRMAHVRYFVAHLERQARACRIELDEAFGLPGTTPE